MPRNRIIFALNIIFFVGIALFIIEKNGATSDGKIAGISLQPWFSIGSWLWALGNIYFLFSLKITWLQNLLTGSIITVLCFVFVEWIFGALLKMQMVNDNKIKISGPNYAIEKDSIVGYTLPADTSLNYTKAVNDSVIYNTVFSTNAQGLRICPKSDSVRVLPQKHALFLGCSFTFGEGLNSNETLEFNFEQKNKNYKSYNFGFSGYGPQQNLARLQRGQIEKYVTQKTGIAIYTYIPDHLRRAVPGTTGYFMHGGVSPNYHWQGDSLVYSGFSGKASWGKKFIYTSLGKSNICKYFKIGYPFYYNQKDQKFIAQMLKQMEAEYLKRFEGNFYVLLYPTNLNYTDLIVELKAKNIKYFDYSKLVDFNNPKYAIKYDNHPRAITNKIVMNQLLKDINLKP